MKLLSLLIISISFLALATPEELFNTRGDNRENALESFSQYEDLYKKENDLKKSLDIKVKALNSLFYYATTAGNEQDEKKYMNQCHQMSLETILKYNKSKDINNREMSEKKSYAQLQYLFGTCLARFSEIDHYTTVLKNWKRIKNAMTIIINLGQEKVYYYGAHRTLGIANLKMPRPFGSRTKAARYISKAYQGTYSDTYSQSSYSFNTIVYSNLLYTEGKIAEACAELKKLTNLSRNDINELNLSLVPEFILNQKDAKDLFIERKCE